MNIAFIYTLPEVQTVAKFIILAFLAFTVTILITPILTHFLYRKKIGIKIKKKSVDGEKLEYVSNLHAHKDGTPTMGGIVIWGTMVILVLLMYFLAPVLANLTGQEWLGRLNFLSRNQTWLPLFALLTTALLGMMDDYMSIKGIGTNKGGGMRFIVRFGWLILISIAGAWWFFFKLESNFIHIPAVGDFRIGFWYIPLFVTVIVSMAISSNETDGMDGLNAGVLIQAFAVFSVIAFTQGRFDIAAFCSVLAGSLLAFLWFNFYPARFFMGDTGAVSLGATLGVVALLTNSVLVLPFVVFVYFVESFSVIIQLFSKKFFKKKVFLSAPIHHHFEAKGWPETKVTVRFWIINGLMACLGLLVGIMGGGI
jgi:phospho-N-acetylmuramoyl-pentapeptide-transferase